MSDRDVCAGCGSADVIGWHYFCALHEPKAVRLRIVSAMSEIWSRQPGSDLEAFVLAHWPLVSPRREAPELRAGSVARMLFDLGRFYERQKYDAIVDAVLRAASPFAACVEADDDDEANRPIV